MVELCQGFSSLCSVWWSIRIANPLLGRAPILYIGALDLLRQTLEWGRGYHMVRPTVMSSWSVVADGPFITKEEGLVVHFACCGLADSFKHGNGNCGAFATELRQTRHFAPATVPM